ncbi:hypothetical protein M011DRAFT_402391 [Sporormia fimetaria CBS 119925]|uniref:F-box domain-containing protein n=1 Tax=Sporormia fimetaria CBS 119925 TaxID=1340428 RepID=A0A6A6VAB6_9PLEO|nr:hypothetical protein M011DRAFT_402391 [Sporormia fimetaria CBS 119925]
MFRRNLTPPGGVVAQEDGIRGRRKQSIGRVAGSLQSKLIRIVRRKGEDQARKRATSRFLTVLFRLPVELHIAILCNLSISDLLSLRRTCRALNELLSECGPALVRFWVRCRLGTLHIKLYPAPKPNEAQFQYLLAMRRRHIASVRLTRELANFVFRDGLKQPCERQRQLWTSVYETMLPLAFVVGHFLEEHRRVILERDLGRIRPRYHVGYDICTTPGITDEEMAIFRRLDHSLRLQYYYMYCFMVQVLVRKLKRPTCASSIGKFVRSWAGHPVCDEDIAFVLVLGGINHVSKLLACRTYSERRRLLHTFITRLSPHESAAWRRHWRDLGVCSPALLDDIPCASIGITQLEQIFEPMMARMMAPDSREFTEQQKMRYEEVRRSKHYFQELMGYDILSGQAADGDNSEAEDDEEMYL